MQALDLLFEDHLPRMIEGEVLARLQCWPRVRTPGSFVRFRVGRDTGASSADRLAFVDLSGRRP